jgi:hypothetical protein
MKSRRLISIASNEKSNASIGALQIQAAIMRRDMYST